MSSLGREPVRVGVLLDSFLVPAWIDRCLEQLAQAEFVDVAVVGLSRRPVRSRSALERLRKASPHLLYDLYERLDRRLFGTTDDAFRLVDARHRFSCEVLEVSQDDLERPEHLATLADFRLDVLLRFGFRGLGYDVARTARYGMWSYSLNDESELGFFRKLADGEHVTCTELQMVTDRSDGGRVIYRSFSETDPISLHRTRNDAHWKAADFVVRRLRGLPRLPGQHPEDSPPQDEGAECEGSIQRHPANLEMAQFLVKLGGRMASRTTRRVLIDQQWFIAYRTRQSGLVPPRDMAGFTAIVPATDRFYADPFLSEGPDGRRYVLFEDYRNVDRKAVISRIELFPDGTISAPRVVLERDYHLSYPFVFRSGGEAYLLPETGQARRVELYRALDFPDRWELHRVLMEGSVVFDATLLEYGGRVWMFANLATTQGKPSNELSIFWSDSLAGNWHPHPQNPVISDVRCARPAGRLIVQDGRLIRPAQDGSVRYGYALVFREILELSPDSFREVELARVTPDWIAGGLLGTHHYDADDELEVVDGRLAIPRWRPRKARVLRFPS